MLFRSPLVHFRFSTTVSKLCILHSNPLYKSPVHIHECKTTCEAVFNEICIFQLLSLSCMKMLLTGLIDGGARAYSSNMSNAGM